MNAGAAPGSGRGGAGGAPEGEADQSSTDPVALLHDLPAPLWGELLRALRRAVDRVPRSELPTVLRPYAGWTPERLAGARPRRAVAQALAGDRRLREEVAETLGAAALADAELGGVRLVSEHGHETAVAALVACARWEELAVVAADAAERLARRRRASAEAPRSAEREDPSVRRLATELAEVRDARDTQRRRADAAEQRARREDAARQDLAVQLAEARAQVAQLQAELVEERRRRDRRVARLRRRVEDAEARARVDGARARRVAQDLERLTADLREALDPAPPASQPPQPPAPPGPAARIPRSVLPAAPGRPCRLPPGVSGDSPSGVQALLRVGGLAVVVDGYNVTMDGRGRPVIGLAEQRRWLVQLGGQVAARYRCGVIIVFDGTETRPAPPPSARGVRVLFTEGDEIADERIPAVVEALGRQTPVLVVSSDRAVQEAAAALDADVASSVTFLDAAGA